MIIWFPTTTFKISKSLETSQSQNLISSELCFCAAMAPTPSSSTEPTRKSGKGRRKIEIKRVGQSSKRLITFSKRKLGLFRKAAEVSLLCKSEIAIIVFSQQGNVFSSDYPNPDPIICRYLSSGSFSSFSHPSSVVGEGELSEVSSLRWEYEEAMKVLEDEKKSLNVGSGSGDRSWWNHSAGEMGLEEVQEFKERLQQLRLNLVVVAEKITTTTKAASPITLPSPTEEKMTTAMTASMVTLLPPTEEDDDEILGYCCMMCYTMFKWCWAWAQ